MSATPSKLVIHSPAFNRHLTHVSTSEEKIQISTVDIVARQMLQAVYNAVITSVLHDDGTVFIYSDTRPALRNAIDVEIDADRQDLRLADVFF